MYLRVKPILDLVASVLAFIPFIIIYIIIGTLIKIDDGGPIFYKAQRIGRNGRKFKMYKFRSMKVDAPDIRNADGTTFNSRDDFRLTRVGRLLRETSLDETAQILNVLFGDMSIVGPRASLPGCIDKYLPEEKSVFKVKPGITGLTQAYYRNNILVEEKRTRDAWYADHVSFWLDLKIVGKTILTVIQRKGIYANESIAKEAARDGIDDHIL